jgi:hypothetical protein
MYARVVGAEGHHKGEARGARGSAQLQPRTSLLLKKVWCWDRTE